MTNRRDVPKIRRVELTPTEITDSDIRDIAAYLRESSRAQ